MTQNPCQPSTFPNCSSDERGYQRIRIRQDTAEGWAKADPILAAGEFGFVVAAIPGSHCLKIGDGTVKWSNLPWLSIDVSGGTGVSLVGIATAWPPSPHPARGDLYIMPDPVPAGAPAWALPGHGAFWTGTDWLDAGLLRGPAGERGLPGPPLNVKGVASLWPPDASPTAGDIWALADAPIVGLPSGFVSGGAAAWDSIGGSWVPLPAIRGPAGHSITVYGPSPTPPATSLVEKGDFWIASDPAVFAATFDPATIVQQPGPPGPQGPIGLSAFDVWRTNTGHPLAPLADYLLAIKGDQGPKGDTGKAGETFRIEGVVPNAAALPAAPPRLTVYLMSTTGELHIYDPTSTAAVPSGWVNLGKIAGPAGRAAWVAPSVYAEANLPAVGQAGQLVYVTSTGHIWGWDDAVAHKWIDGGKIGHGIDDGTIQGQTLIWDATNAKWQPADNTTIPEGNDEGDILVWNATTSKYEAVHAPRLNDGTQNGDIAVWDELLEEWTPASHRMGTEENCNFPTDPADSESGVPVYSNSTDQFDVRRLSLDDLSNGPGNVIPNDGDLLAWEDASQKWLPTSAPAGTLSGLSDVDLTTPPTDGQVPSWNATTSKWVPKSTSSPIVFIGTGALVPANVSLAASNYGMPLDTVPPPASYPPAPGDQYLDLATGLVSAFTGTIVGSPRAGTITGVSSPASRDLVPEKLNDLSDVTIVGLVDKQVLEYDGVAGAWKNAAPAYTKAEIDTKVSALVIGFSHGVAVQSIAQDPPASPVIDEVYIVGTTPTGLFATHANELAVWNGTNWVFSAAQPSEAHLVEDQLATFGWSGTAWVKVATAISGGSSAKAGVGEIIPWIGDTFPATDYLECKGQVVAIATYADLYGVVGNKYNASATADGTTTFALPDLRGYFLRGDNTGLPVGLHKSWSTGLPKAGFSTNSAGSHNHSFRRNTGNFSGDGKYRDASLSTIQSNNGGESVSTGIVDGGAHTHTVTGGDIETAPAHFIVKWLIRYRPINGGATGATGPKGDATPLGDVWQVGSIQQSMLTEAQWTTLLGPAEGAKWVLADGRNCTGTKFGQITGKTILPDLRGAFLRSAGQNRSGDTRWNGGDVGQWYEDSTARPKTALTGTAATGGNHSHVAASNSLVTGWKENSPIYFLTDGATPSGIASDGAKRTDAGGDHTHTVTITGGGDAQTAPVHVAVNTFIKIN